MLILTRRAGETVMIGSDVTITVLGVKGNQVRIGINAPKDVAVHREEIYERIQSEKARRRGRARMPISPNSGSALPHVLLTVICAAPCMRGGWPRTNRRDG